MVKLEWDHFGPVPATEPDAIAAARRFYFELKEAFPIYVADFEHKFTAWQGKWSGLGSSSTYELCEYPEYDPLLLLGPKTIPLVVYELSNPENFFATNLYNHLELNKEAKVNPEDIINYLTLNRHANLIVELNHERAQQAKARIDAWRKTHAAGNSTNNKSNKNENEEYQALVNMGPGIIAHVMLEYSKDQSGPWYKLLHELVCEKPVDMVPGSRGQEVDVREQYAKWKEWFERREHHEAAGLELGEEGFVPGYLKSVGFQCDGW